MKKKIIVLFTIFLMSFSVNVIAEPVDTYEDSKMNEAYTELYELIEAAVEIIIITEDESTVSELESTIDSITETLENNKEMTVEERQALEEVLQNEMLSTEASVQETIDAADLEALIIEAENTLSQLNEQEVLILEAALQEAKELLESEPTQAEVDEMVVQLEQAIEAALAVKETQDEEVIDALITIVTKGDYDRSEANRMIQRLQNMAPVLYQGLIDSGVKMYLVNFPITELEEFEDLAGVIPPGWEDEGKTWDDVPGAGGINSVARIGYSEPNIANGHGSFNLELHEIGHPIDEFVLNNISSSEEFQTIHQAEQGSFLVDPYFESPSEYFAETFSYYFLNEESRNQLRIMAPKTYSFFQRISGEEQADEPSIESLVQAIEEVRAMDDSLITEELYEAFESALIVRDNPASTQEEIDAAELQLRDAFQVVKESQEFEEEPPPIDKSELNLLIEEAVGLVEETSPASFIEALDNAYNISQNPHATQDEVDAAIEHLASEIDLAQFEREANIPQEEDNGDIEAISNDSDDDIIAVGSSNHDNTLPTTSTNVFNYLFIGLTLIISGITAILSRKMQYIINKDYFNEFKYTISR